VPRASTRPGDLGPTDPIWRQVQVTLEKASGTLNASRLQKGWGRLVHLTAHRTRSMTKPVSRAYLRQVRRTLLRSRPDDKEVAVKLVAVVGALGIGALLVLLGLKQKKTRQGSAS
jgi:hypothetical protein